MKDFTPVARVGTYVFMLVVNRTSLRKTLPELVAYAKANPGKLTYASGNTTGIVAGETLKSRGGIDVLVSLQEHAACAQRRARRGRIDDVHRSRTGAGTRARRNSARARGDDERAQRAVARPAFSAEAGIPGYDVTSCAGLFAPAGTPKEIVDAAQ